MFRRKVAVKKQQTFGFKEEEEVKPECYHPFTEEAQVLLQKHQYNTALKYLDISLDFTPDNPLTLATKSGCLINLFEPEEAMPSAAHSLVEYKRYVEEELDGQQETVYALGLLKKAESLYHQTEFEQALVFFHRGAKLRPNMELFHKGIKKAKKAILNAIGENTQTHFEDIIGLLPKICTVSEIISNRQGFPKFQPCTSLSPMHRDELIKEVLGPLRKDAKFVNNIKKDHKPLKALDDELQLQTKAEEIHRFLDNRQDFWCKQNPLYSRCRVVLERDAKMAAKEAALRKIRQEEFELKKEDCMRHVAEWKEMIDAALKEKDWDSVIELNLELEEYIKSKSEEFLVDKWAQLIMVYSCMVQAETARVRYHEAMSAFERLWEAVEAFDSTAQGVKPLTVINAVLGIKMQSQPLRDSERLLRHFTALHKEYHEAMSLIERLREAAEASHSNSQRVKALAVIGRTHAAFKMNKNAISDWEEMLPLISDINSKSWLFHELGRCHLKLGMITKAQVYGSRCLASSKMSDDAKLAMHARTLMAEVELSHGENNKALIYLDAARCYATSPQDLEYINKFQDAILQEPQNKTFDVSFRPSGIRKTSQLASTVISKASAKITKSTVVFQVGVDTAASFARSIHGQSLRYDKSSEKIERDPKENIITEKVSLSQEDKSQLKKKLLNTSNRISLCTKKKQLLEERNKHQNKTNKLKQVTNANKETNMKSKKFHQ